MEQSNKTTKNKIVALSVIILGAIIFVYALINGFVYHPEKEVPVAAEPQYKEQGIDSPGIPTRLVIPKISVDAKVDEVGITVNGNMGVPKTLYDTGWYKYGTIPGTVGTAVIDGHVDNGFNLPGVFNKLKNLSINDDVYVETDSGKRLHFVVVETAIYPYKEVPLDKLFNVKDSARLNLVTCDGAWVPSAKTAENRLVVYTKLANE